MKEGNQWAWRQSNKNEPIWITGRKDTEKNEQSPRDLVPIIKDALFLSSESQKKSMGLKVYEDLTAENFPNLAKHINLQIQKAEQTQNMS